jgi:enoyl-CoA hydratase/carnithine racemase
VTDVPVYSSTADGVTTIVLNRPGSRNAMSRDLVEGLLEQLYAAQDDPGVHAVVLTGADPVFCAGADLREMSSSSPEETESRVDLSLQLYNALPNLSLPVIGAINGHALAGGCGLAMACDLVIASEQAQFGFPESQRGLVAALVMVSLSRLITPRHALDLLLTGRRIQASEALSLGMINEMVPKDQVLPRAVELARQLAALEPTALAMTKNLYYRVADSSVTAGMEQARLTNLLFRSFDTAMSGARAFFTTKASEPTTAPAVKDRVEDPSKEEK